MAFISAYVGTGIFALCVGMAVAVVATIAIFIPLTLYVTPFCIWLGFKQQNGKYKSVKLNKLVITARNATRLYKSWLSKTPPILIAPNKSFVRE